MTSRSMQDGELNSMDKAKGERGGVLTQQQYDMIKTFLETGKMPLMKDQKGAKNPSSCSKSEKQNLSSSTYGFESLRQFKAWARRMYVENGVLKHKLSGKIILAKEKFVAVVKEIHNGRIEDTGMRLFKHLSAVSTMKKIHDKYTMGKRSFGMSEELVKSVVRTCKTGSCLKLRRRKISKDKLKFGKHSQDSSKPENKVMSPLRWRKYSVKNLVTNKDLKMTDSSCQLKETNSAVSSTSTALSNAVKSKHQRHAVQNQTGPKLQLPAGHTSVNQTGPVAVGENVPNLTRPELPGNVVQNQSGPMPVSLFRYTKQGFVYQPMKNATSTNQSFRFLLPNTLQILPNSETSVLNIPTTWTSTNTLVNPNLPTVMESGTLACQNYGSSINTLPVVPTNTLTTSQVLSSSNTLTSTTSQPNNVMLCVIPLSLSNSTSVTSSATSSTTMYQKPLLASMLQNDVKLCSLGSSKPARAYFSSKTSNSGTKRKLKAKIQGSKKIKHVRITKQDACRNLTDALNKCSRNILNQRNIKYPQPENQKDENNNIVSDTSVMHHGYSGNENVDEKIEISDDDIVLIEDELNEEEMKLQTQLVNDSANMNDVVLIKSDDEEFGEVVALNHQERKLGKQKRIKLSKTPVPPKPGPLPHPPIWYYCNDLSKQNNCYTSLLMAIHDMKIDITKSYLRDISATERVKRKLSFADSLVKKLKTYVEQCRKYQTDTDMELD